LNQGLRLDLAALLGESVSFSRLLANLRELGLGHGLQFHARAGNARQRRQRSRGLDAG
jgi:hypothetical protein